MGVYSQEPDPPVYYAVVNTADLVRYTDSAQAQWFIDRINYAYGGYTANVRIEPDGSTIRWFGYYFLGLGDWLWQGTSPMSDEVVRASALRPVPLDFPDDPSAPLPPAEGV